MTRLLCVAVGIFLAVTVTAVLAVQEYVSLPPNSGVDMGLLGLPFRCLVYGVPCGVVAGLVLAQVIQRLPPRQRTSAEAAKRRRMALGAGAVTVTGGVAFLFLGHGDTRRLASTVPLVMGTAREQGFVAVWNPAQPDLLVVILPPRSYARIDYNDDATWYYCAFSRARHAAGYSVASSLRGSVEIRQGGVVEKRRSLRNLFLVD